MKKYRWTLNLISVMLVGVLLAGCNNAKPQVDKEVYPINSINKKVAIVAVDTIIAGERDTIIILKDGQAYVKGHINPKSKVDYILPTWKNQEITAVVKAVSSKGNIRISQIQKPGGDFDGPFGDSLVYKSDANGNIHFIIGENMMAEPPYTGDFVLHVKVKE